MIRTAGGLIGAALLLASCATNNFAQIDNDKCRSYGAAPGSAAYVNCRAQLQSARAQALAIMSLR